MGDQVKNIVSEVKRANGTNFDPANMINISIANIITRIITGKTYDWEDQEFRDIVAASGKLFDVSGPAGLFTLNPTFSQLPLPVNREVRRLTTEIYDFISRYIQEHKQNFDPDEIPKDFIGSYLKEMAKADVSFYNFFYIVL